MKESNNFKKSVEEIQTNIDNLALIDDSFFSFVLNDNIELAEDILEPVSGTF